MTDFTPARFIADNRSREMAVDAIDRGIDADEAFDYLWEHEREVMKELIINDNEFRDILIHFLTSNRKFVGYYEDYLSDIYNEFNRD